MRTKYLTIFPASKWECDYYTSKNGTSLLEWKKIIFSEKFKYLGRYHVSYSIRKVQRLWSQAAMVQIDNFNLIEIRLFKILIFLINHILFKFLLSVQKLKHLIKISEGWNEIRWSDYLSENCPYQEIFQSSLNKNRLGTWRDSHYHTAKYCLFFQIRIKILFKVSSW